MSGPDLEGYTCVLADRWLIVDRFGARVPAAPAFDLYADARRHVEDLNAAVHAARFVA